jgi:hypothetical protein
MKNATISTSRTRADDRPLITYRPLDPRLGEAESLREVRAARRRVLRWATSWLRAA